jgi:hypothetical protein
MPRSDRCIGETARAAPRTVIVEAEMAGREGVAATGFAAPTGERSGSRSRGMQIQRLSFEIMPHS